MIDPEEGARRIVGNCLGLRPGETVGLLVDDEIRSPVADLLQAAISDVGGNATTAFIDDSLVAPDLPEADIPADLMTFDVVVGLTARSMYHASLGRAVATRGGRVLALTQSDMSSLTSPALTADFAALSPYANRLAAVMGEASRIRVTTPSGTDLEASLAGRDGYTCTGLARDAGIRNGCPDIESYIAPVESTACGVVVIDASSTPFGLVLEPVALEFENGILRAITGGDEADRLSRYLSNMGPEMRTFAEIGIGLNPHCRVVGRIVEDEGTYGTGHFAVGSNDGFGGDSRAPAHVDLVYWHPSVQLDSVTVFKDGEYVAEPDFAENYTAARPDANAKPQ